MNTAFTYWDRVILRLKPRLDSPVDATILEAMWASKPYVEARAIQRSVSERTQEKNLRVVELCALARAFCELEECKRRIKQKPLPKAIDVSSKGKRNQELSPAGMSESS